MCNLHSVCINHSHSHTHTCQNYYLRVKSHSACGNLTLRVETNHVRVGIKHVRVEITLERVVITLASVKITHFECRNHSQACFWYYTLTCCNCLSFFLLSWGKGVITSIKPHLPAPPPMDPHLIDIQAVKIFSNFGNDSGPLSHSVLNFWSSY
jgi:hypothetical protein